MRRLERLALGLLLPLSLCAHAGDGLRPFDSASYQAIAEEHHGQPFVLAFWSLDCPPCHRELAELGQWMSAHPDTALVLVSTDENPGDEALDVLRGYGLQNADNWAMTVPFDTPVRYAIDPLWYGELPRSYLFDAEHRRQTVSGVLGEQALDQWHAQIVSVGTH